MSSLDPSGAHLSDSVADFMHTSWSADDLYYGWSWSNMIGPAFIELRRLRRATVRALHVRLCMGSTLTWTLVKGEIDAGRPLVFLVDSDGDGNTDHFVTVIGYRESGGYPEYACWDTWSTSSVRWATFRAMSSSYTWGVWSATTFHLAAPVTLTAPNGGEDWTSGQVHTITWTPGVGDVKLEVSREGGRLHDHRRRHAQRRQLRLDGDGAGQQPGRGAACRLSPSPAATSLTRPSRSPSYPAT